MTTWASSRVEDDVGVREAQAGSVEVTALRFPPGYVQRPFPPQLVAAPSHGADS